MGINPGRVGILLPHLNPQSAFSENRVSLNKKKK
jgi:hypothetical protein